MASPLQPVLFSGRPQNPRSIPLAPLLPLQPQCPVCSCHELQPAPTTLGLRLLLYNPLPMGVVAEPASGWVPSIPWHRGGRWKWGLCALSACSFCTILQLGSLGSSAPHQGQVEGSSGCGTVPITSHSLPQKFVSGHLLPPKEDVLFSGMPLKK